MISTNTQWILVGVLMLFIIMFINSIAKKNRIAVNKMHNTLYDYVASHVNALTQYDNDKTLQNRVVAELSYLKCAVALNIASRVFGIHTMPLLDDNKIPELKIDLRPEHYKTVDDLGQIIFRLETNLTSLIHRIPEDAPKETEIREIGSSLFSDIEKLKILKQNAGDVLNVSRDINEGVTKECQPHSPG